MMGMNAAKKEALESKGYTVGSADQFLGLTKEESEIIEMQLALAKALFSVPEAIETDTGSGG
jgi:hypothetical protein